MALIFYITYNFYYWLRCGPLWRSLRAPERFPKRDARLPRPRWPSTTMRVKLFVIFQIRIPSNLFHLLLRLNVYESGRAALLFLTSPSS